MSHNNSTPFLSYKTGVDNSLKFNDERLEALLLSQRELRFQVTKNLIHTRTIKKDSVLLMEVRDTNSIWKRKILTLGRKYFYNGEMLKSKMLCTKLSTDKDIEIANRAKSLK